MNAHGDALCFMVKTWAHKTTEALLNNGWRLVAVGGGWRLAVGGPWGLPSRAVLEKKRGVFRTALPEREYPGPDRRFAVRHCRRALQ